MARQVALTGWHPVAFVLSVSDLPEEYVLGLREEETMQKSSAMGQS